MLQACKLNSTSEVGKNWSALSVIAFPDLSTVDSLQDTVKIQVFNLCEKH